MYRRLFAGLLAACMLFLGACSSSLPVHTETPGQSPQTSASPDLTPSLPTAEPKASASPADESTQDPSMIETPSPAETDAWIDVITPTPEPTPKMPDVTPLLWKVTGKAGQEIYILGSVEAADSEFYPIPTYVMDIYEKCDILSILTNFQAFEKDTKRQLDIADTLLNPDGKTLDAVIDEDLYASCRNFLTSFKRYSSVYDYYNGAFWYKLMCDALLSGSPLSPQNGPEAWFLKRAGTDHKEIWEIEEAEEYYWYLNSFSKELIEFLLAYTAATSPEDYNALLKSRYSHFLKGNQEKLEQDMEKRAIYFTDYALADEYTEKLEEVRRNNILNDANHCLETGERVFYVLDLDYLLGSDGLLSALASEGYRVEIVEPTPEPTPTPEA